MRPLYKTTVVIWSEYDGAKLELSRLAREAEEGDAYCSRSGSVLVSDPEGDEAWDGTEFFGVDEDEDRATCSCGMAWADEPGHDHDDPECE